MGQVSSKKDNSNNVIRLVPLDSSVELTSGENSEPDSLGFKITTHWNDQSVTVARYMSYERPFAEKDFNELLADPEVVQVNKTEVLDSILKEEMSQ